jgi:hypothetical protein
MRGVKIFFGVLCFGIGVAFAVGAAHAFMHQTPYDDNVFDTAFPAFFGAMFLLGSYLLLRREPAG